MTENRAATTAPTSQPTSTPTSQPTSNPASEPTGEPASEPTTELIEQVEPVTEEEQQTVVTGEAPRERSFARLGGLGLAVMVLLCGLTLVLGFANKDRCAGPEFDSLGRTVGFLLRADKDVCYSDIQYLWVGRDINEHVIPYLHGGIAPDGQLYGGTVEYPVLTGVLMWAGAWFAHDDAQYLLGSAFVLAPFALLTAFMLGRLAGWRALAWAIGSPLVLYAFHNWDLAVVACAVAAAYVMHWRKYPSDAGGLTGSAGKAAWSLHTRAMLAGVLLGLGFAFKLYPILFVPPLLAYVATGGEQGQEKRAGRRFDLAGVAKVTGVTAATVLLVNLPFMVLGYRGWLASFTFQEHRTVDITTNSFWFWGFRPLSDPGNKKFQHLVDIASPTLILAACALALGLGWLRYRRSGTYPWLAVSAAMLCGFLLFHKVHSPQYTLWLVPMFVLLRIRWGWIIAYYVADLAMGVGIFRYYYAINTGKPYGIYDGLAEQATVVGVWGRAALLVGLFFAFLAAPTVFDRFDRIRTGRTPAWSPRPLSPAPRTASQG